MTTRFREKAPTKSTKPHYHISELIQSQLLSRKIALGDIGIADDGATLLAGNIKARQEMIALDLRGNRITSYGLIEVVKFLRKSVGIESISLNWNDLENESSQGLVDLCDYVLDTNSQVKYLDLSSCNLSMNSKTELARIARCPTLKYLDLSWNNFTDDFSKDLITAMNQRSSALHIELKGSGLSQIEMSKFAEALKNLELKYPSVNLKSIYPEDAINGIESKKRMILDNLYNQERIEKMRRDTGQQTILNPDISELEVLMAEMFKKKIVAKDRLLREVDEKLTSLKDLEAEIRDLLAYRDQSSNENMALRRELESKKAEYSKKKQSSIIEQDSLSSQVKNMQATLNKRDIEHRTNTDRLIDEHRLRLNNLAEELDNKDKYMVDKIKTLIYEKERMEADIDAIKKRMALMANNLGSDLRTREEQYRLEHHLRADLTCRLLESRALTLTEGNEMSQRRGVDELKFMQEEELAFMQRIAKAQEEVDQKRSVLGSLNEAIRIVDLENEKMRSEAQAVESACQKVRAKLSDTQESIKRKVGMVEAGQDEAVERMLKEKVLLEDGRANGEHKLLGLEELLRKVKNEIGSIDAKREYFVSLASQKVSRVIYDTLVKKYEPK